MVQDQSPGTLQAHFLWHLVLHCILSYQPQDCTNYPGGILGHNSPSCVIQNSETQMTSWNGSSLSIDIPK